MTPSRRRVVTTEGVGLQLLSWDGGPLAPVLCVHGLASNARTWEGVGDRLHALGHPVAAVDLRGQGRSDAPDEGYDFTTMGVDLLAVLDGVGWARAVLAGQSTGGNLVVNLAARAPDRVVAVVGVDGGAFDLKRRWPVWDDCATALAPPQLTGTPAPTMEGFIRRAHPDWSDAGIAATMANFEIRPDGSVRPWLTFERHMRILRALWEHRPAEDLAEIEAPALLLLAHSGDDWSATKRDDSDAARDVLPSIEVHWFADADHDLHIQHPEGVADLIHAATL